MLTYPPVKKVSVVIPVYNEQDSLQDCFVVRIPPAPRWGGNMKFC